ncbi:hypothetical protein PM3016_2393 [Paenibacillus mucilaginosus 3016]|uniref:Uncharacterized protein n=1 Tax=Paenibacillus mucilaginosus 3016 TaxID=1116391 RepID=H6NKX5_9BACL|nr:hypothetical protein PM3016_2393 [Paenibacillus mucilaginosus 3016]
MKATFMQSVTERKKICPNAEEEGMHDWKARRYLFKATFMQSITERKKILRAWSVHSIASLRLRYWTGVMP